jgi:hypothetical protein
MSEQGVLDLVKNLSSVPVDSFPMVVGLDGGGNVMVTKSKGLRNSIYVIWDTIADS